jgi:uncharacterized membrane protein YhiD involved in acid resistance
MTPTADLIADVVEIGGPTVSAALLGALFTFLPARWRELRKKKKGVEMLKAQVLFCTAGAMLVVVIGTDKHAAARAFGLLGLGSFIRFRTVLKNPTDTAVFFILIGIGMACGVGRPGAALFGTLFLMLVLTLLDRITPSQSPSGEDKSE